MSERRTRFASSVGTRKAAAWLALLAFVLLVLRFALLAYQNVLDILGLIACVALLGVGLWWALTGRKVKMWVGVALSVLAVVGVLVVLVLLIKDYLRQFLFLVLWATLFAFFSSRALDLPSLYRQWRANRVALPARARTISTPLPAVTRPAALIVNLKAGGGKAEQIHLVDRARELGIVVQVLEPDTELTELARGAVADGAEVIGMAGGDGSQALVAGVAMDNDLPFVCIPVGTRNHFARDLGLDRQEPLAALAAFEGQELRIDTGRIGDRVFLNNATFGVYADMVHDPGYREAKLPTAQTIVSEVLNGDRPPAPLEFDGPDHEHFTSAFLVMVVVGPYSFDSLTDMGVRSSMTDGILQVTVLEPADERQLRRITAAAVLGSVTGADGFWQWTTRRLTIGSPSGQVHVGVDGEALTLPTPLEMEVRPRSLRVLLPPDVEPVPGPQSPGLGVTIGDLWNLATGTTTD